MECSLCLDITATPIFGNGVFITESGLPQEVEPSRIVLSVISLIEHGGNSNVAATALSINIQLARGC